MRNHTCHLDHHQRSHSDTITIGPEGMIHWELQLNNSQLRNSFNSLLEKHHVLNSPNQPNPNPIQFVIDQGDLMKCKMKEKRPRSPEINVISFNEELSCSDRKGRPVETEEIQARSSEDRVSMSSRLMIEQGDLLTTQLQYKTTLKYIMRLERSTLVMKHFVKE